MIPLAHAGMIAIHSVVGTDEVWGLLPRLKAAGASGHPRPADREDPPVTGAPHRGPAPTSGCAGSTSGRPTTATPASATPCSGAAPSPTRRSARPRARSSPTSASAAARPSATPRRGSAAGGRDGRLLARPATSSPPPPTPSRRASAPRSRPRSRTSAGSPRPSARPATPDRRSSRASSSSAAGSRSTASGAYVPGGSAPYPSSLVMTVVPARVAGVGAVVVASPADAQGDVHPVLLGAAGLLGVDALLVAGGVQAIGALAYRPPDEGLEPVDLVVGPGQRLGDGRQARARGRRRHRPARRTLRGPRARRRRRGPRDRRRRPHHPGRARPRLPCPARDPDEALADAVEAEVRRRLATALRRDILARALADHGRIVLVAGPRRRRSPSSTATPRSTCRSTSRTSRPPSPGSATPARSSSGAGRPSPPATTPRAPTTSSRPAASRAAAARSPSRRTASYSQVQRITREGLAALRPTIRDARRGRGPARPPRRRRGPLRRPTTAAPEPAR